MTFESVSREYYPIINQIGASLIFLYLAISWFAKPTIFLKRFLSVFCAGIVIVECLTVAMMPQNKMVWWRILLEGLLILGLAFLAILHYKAAKYMEELRDLKLQKDNLRANEENKP